MNVETAIIPVAGFGTRLLPITSSVPKELLPLGRKPVLRYIAEELAQAGIKRVLLVTSEIKREIGRMFERDEQLEQRLMDSNKHELLELLWSHSPYSNIQFEIAIQEQRLGLGHAVLCGEQIAEGRPFVVALGDSVIGIGGQTNVLPRMLHELEAKNADIVIAFEEVRPDQVNQFGIAHPKSDGVVFELADLVEKPELGQAPSNLAIAARYVLPPQIFETLKSTSRGKDNEIQLTDAVRSMIANGAKAIGVCLGKTERRFDVGNTQAYTRAFAEFALKDPMLRTEILAATEEFNRRD